MRMIFILLLIILALLIFSPTMLAQSTTAGEHRIIEPITVNGQSAVGVMVLQNGMTQTYSCDSPQPYVTAQSERGWACFEQATGMWLLHSQPPLDIAAEPQQSPTVIYGEPNNVYVPLPDGYPYYPYAYGYPYYWGAPFGGFAFNFGHFGRGFHDGHGFAPRGFNHGVHGFAHGGPAFGNNGGFHGGGFHGGGHMGGGGFHGGGGGGHMGGGGFHGGGGGGHMGGVGGGGRR